MYWCSSAVLRGGLLCFYLSPNNITTVSTLNRRSSCFFFLSLILRGGLLCFHLSPNNITTVSTLNRRSSCFSFLLLILGCAFSSFMSFFMPSVFLICQFFMSMYV